MRSVTKKAVEGVLSVGNATQCSDLWVSQDSVEGMEHGKAERGSIVIGDTAVTRE